MIRPGRLSQNLLLVGALLLGSKTAWTADTPPVLDVGGTKQCFIDSRLIDSSRGVTLTMHSPRREGHPLVTPDQPWEKDSYITVYCSALKERGKVRLWYGLLQPTGPGPDDHLWRVCYAESDDGLHFTKPILNLHEVNGSIEVELLGENDQPLAGFARSDAIALNGNSVRLPVRWRGGSDVSSLAGRPARLRFHVRDCKLYAFQFCE